MKIAAVLFILSVYYIANTEQAAIAAPGVRPYPRSWDELQRKAQQGMAKMNAKTLIEQDTPEDFLRECASQECPVEEVEGKHTQLHNSVCAQLTQGQI